MPLLKWSEHRSPDGKTSRYDHVIAETPLGQIILEWKSWKKYDSPGAQMPWGDFVGGHDLDDAKEKVQAAWDAMVRRIVDEQSTSATCITCKLESSLL